MEKLEAQSITISVGGREIIFETGKIARQAGGAVMVRAGDTMLLGTACMGPALDEVDFLPMRVDYQEKFSSAGKTLGGFIKREGRPTEKETLTCRLIDRPIRPMFEDGYYSDTQIITTVLSYDGVNQTEPLAICAASAALVLSEIPFIKPIGAVRVGMIDGNFIINPTLEEMESSVLDLVIAGTEDAILMIEGYCDFLSEDQIMDSIDAGHEAIKVICQKLGEWQQVIGKEKNREGLRFLPEGLMEEVDQIMAAPLKDAIRIVEKDARNTAISEIKEKVKESLLPEEDAKYKPFEVGMAMKKVTAHHMRQMVLKEKKRCDGRNTSDVRQIWVDMAPLPRTHGSTLFTRGETQAIAVCTLGGESMGQRYETLDKADGLRNFYLQYSFPPYSVGEVGRMGPPGRREVGHGKLAERALTATIPNKDDFPYTIRLESNITESNGSSSMASICGCCLAMMEAGVPIKRPIAGIAMGLILEKESFAVLSDILGMEDALGDMDFKIAGDENGITAFQLDIKVEGIDKQIMKTALAQAKEGRIHILKKMLEACPKSKESLSEYAPRIETIKIKPSQIGTVIGPGGKQIRAIVEETGVDINIDDDGYVSIASTCSKGMDRARQIIHDLTAEVEEGKTYKGKVVSVKDFGLFVAILNVQGLCHISEIKHERIERISDHYKEGDEIEVKVLKVDPKTGKISLSRKALLEAPVKA
ncbi:polyribonucleotide nucleotidyltransferase [Candidatus Neptunochlamydia vexilliferae]|uniref:Polyribonucleotide nucleotidyltransferase n=1 Tax=Candidatus Neptunichlamydia vexilliferae TaxID=1651774 RepID=A0ABS0AZF3_9BACT|nr:polyribonucleotide nucleotidyltransferase [Candidatus Neptunochlamydia vexilliferae]MBF5059508.1 Polyribonucleotide nucleotidyltransferase [Candidatus Neptunochlamydia vexilliferae]